MKDKVLHIPHIPNICVCFASDDNYAPYVRTTIFSLLCNRNTQYGYDILILHTNISEENRRKILDLSHDQGGVTIRFIDVSDMESEVQYKFRSYYSIATNYRLFLLSEMFEKYEKIIYLDSDMIILGDISELFYMDMEGKAIAAVEDIGMRQLQYSKRALYIDGSIPYDALNYRKYALGMKPPYDYFNAGVIVFDLDRCRELCDFKEVVETLHSKHFTFNDQDTLNIMFDGQVRFLDPVWNYQNNIEVYLTLEDKAFTQLFFDVKRTKYQIIHYIGPKKPWNEKVNLDKYYKRYMNELTKEKK